MWTDKMYEDYKRVYDGISEQFDKNLVFSSEIDCGNGFTIDEIYFEERPLNYRNGVFFTKVSAPDGIDDFQADYAIHSQRELPEGEYGDEFHLSDYFDAYDVCDGLATRIIEMIAEALEEAKTEE